MWNLDTIVKAIRIVGDTTPAAMQLYEGFIAVLRGKDQDELKQRYEAAKKQSDQLHQDVQSI